MNTRNTLNIRNNKKPVNKLLMKFFVSVILLAAFPRSTREMFLFFFVRQRNRDPVMILRMIIRSLPNPQSVMLLLYLIVIAAVVILGIRLLASLSGITAGSSKTKLEKKTEKEIETIEKSFQSAYKSGKDRYIEQLDGFLKSGYLDQKSYNEMLKKYKDMNIPYGF